MKRPMIQVDLMKTSGPKRAAKMTTWVDVKKEMVEGSIITLKGVEGEWIVQKIYDNEVDISELGVRGFENNI